MPPETRSTTPASESEEKKKELRRVYRKLKGVRTQLSVKVRQLRKEISETTYSGEDSEAEEERNLLDTPREDEWYEGIAADDKLKKVGKAGGGMQSEVKALVDHKRRLRKRFWELQGETRRSK